MIRILFTLMTCLALTAQAFTPQTGKQYYIKLADANLYVKTKTLGSNNPGATFSAQGSAFTIMQTANGLAFYSDDNGAYLNYGTANNWNTLMESSAAYWTVEQIGSTDTYTIKHNYGGTMFNLGNGSAYRVEGGGIYAGETSNVAWTFVEVQKQASLFDAEKKYILRSASGTYLNLGEQDDKGTASNAATAVFYKDEPSVFTITQSGSGYVFEDENGHYIGVNNTNRYTWNVDNTQSFVWTVAEVDADAHSYYISQSAGSNYLGNKDTQVAGTGIYTNQPSTVLWYIEEYSVAPGEEESPVYEENPAVVCDFLNRIGGAGTSNRIETLLNSGLMNGGRDQFVISSKDGKPYIQASSISAVTTGIGWYLNHYAHVNLAWNNNVRTNLSGVSLPVPSADETHLCDADYRYYLNYCTFGYSMTTWTWERWEQEIDWMALHGINMPLQIIGLETVWRDFLMQDYGYSKSEAEDFVAGPAFMAWFGMNNLEGWGASKESGWYERQRALAKKIGDRERQLGMQPVLPGFSGMVPSNFTSKTGIASENQGLWCRFVRPAIMDPTGGSFAEVAQKYYMHLEDVMGTSKYYSMDPFHEGGAISSGKYAEGYTAVYNAMNTNCGKDTKWVIQQWQWASYQRNSLTAVPSGRLIVLDLFADGSPAFDSYAGYAPQDAVYCTIPNFGGRTGFMGRIPKMADNYFTYKAKYATVKGIGAAPEAIESIPVAYDLLFELPWMGSKPDTQAWMEEYATARYGSVNAIALEAWEELRSTALNNTTNLQGPHEAVVCARPALVVNKVSSWGGTNIFYNTQSMIDAAFKLHEMGRPTTENGAANYSYDLTDIARQALTDYAKNLLAAINEASGDKTSAEFTERRDAFLELILDIDRLLGTNTNFRLGKWTQEARDAASEVEGYTTATQDWYELDNARTLITTWGDYAQSENGGLRDYSYREWQGLLKDYYYPRWKYYFDHNLTAPAAGWFYHDWDWAHRMKWNDSDTDKSTTPLSASEDGYSYSAAPEGDTYEVAGELLQKYFKRVTKSDGTVYYECLLLDSGMDDLWTKPTQDIADMGTISSYKQYVNTIQATVNSGASQTIYTTASCPTSLYHHTQNVGVKAGDQVSLKWTGNDGLKYCYLSVYLDSDGDGVFDSTPVATVGTNGATNNAVINGTVTINVPSDITALVTHVRMRFDSAWNIAANADASTTRMVYEVPFVFPVAGDYNGDGKVSLADLTALIALVLEGSHEQSEIGEMVELLLEK